MGAFLASTLRDVRDGAVTTCPIGNEKRSVASMARCIVCMVPPKQIHMSLKEKPYYIGINRTFFSIN